MNKKTKTIIAVGGTGGHVIPGYNLAKHLYEKNFSVEIVSDKRGDKYINKKNNFKVFILPSITVKYQKYDNLFYFFNDDFIFNFKITFF